MTSPLSLQRNMWWLLTLTCGFRGRDESRKLKFGVIRLCFVQKTNRNGQFCRELKHILAKIHQAILSREPLTHQYETGGDWCPIWIYQLFVSQTVRFINSSISIFPCHNTIGQNCYGSKIFTLCYLIFNVILYCFRYIQ